MSHPTTVLVRHATPTRNLKSILSQGLLPAFARGRLKVVWLHTPGRSAWAVAHVAGRHRVAASSVALLTLAVPRSALRRARRGVWLSAAVVPPACVVSVRLPQFAAAS